MLTLLISGLMMSWSRGIWIQNAQAESVAVPVHSLPHSCNVHGFPQVMEAGILGCFKDGRTGLWLSENSQQTQVLPVGTWAQGRVLFQAGVESGLWDVHSETWSVPSRRIPDLVAEGQMYATEETIVWTTDERVHQLDIQTNQQRQRAANPLHGIHPIDFDGQVAWIEWGTQMGIHLWNVAADTHTWIPSEYPSSLIHHRGQLVWVSEGWIVVWSFEKKSDVRSESRVQEVFSTAQGLCWTQWVNDIDIVCDSGFHLQRLGHQSNPVWKGESLYFTESDTLWVYKSITQE